MCERMSVRERGRSFCVPSMTIDLEVQVLWGVGRNDPSNPQGELVPIREGGAERSGSKTCGATNRNRIGGRADQGERARNREALATKGEPCRSGARAGTVDESYLGRSRLAPERATGP
jgi:hypothetical protein